MARAWCWVVLPRLHEDGEPGLCRRPVVGEDAELGLLFWVSENEEPGLCR